MLRTWLLLFLLLGIIPKNYTTGNTNKNTPLIKEIKVQSTSNKLNETKNIKPTKTIKNIKLKKFDSEYCELTKKDLEYNQILIEANIDRSFHILYDSVIHPLRRQFLLEITMAETNLGFHSSYLSMGGTKGKGAWSLDRIAFDATKQIKYNPQLIPYLAKFKEKTGIDWIKDVQWEHCNYVFFGAIAAQLYLIINKIPISDNLNDRAVNWKIYYNTYLGKGQPKHYIERVNRYIQS